MRARADQRPPRERERERERTLSCARGCVRAGIGGRACERTSPRSEAPRRFTARVKPAGLRRGQTRARDSEKRHADAGRRPARQLAVFLEDDRLERERERERERQREREREREIIGREKGPSPRCTAWAAVCS